MSDSSAAAHASGGASGADADKPALARLAPLVIGALGVVYGDIGTSPLYAIRECFSPLHGVPLNEANVLGVLSLVFWSLVLVVCVKYIFFVMRADNKGEGGIMALIALLLAGGRHPVQSKLILLGLVGTALLFADGMITPVMSVLGAVEGLEVATTAFKPFVVPITIAILVGLFFMQSRGTARVAAIFGPAMIVWFLCLIAMGLYWIPQAPRVLAAVVPHHAVMFFIHNKLHGFIVLGAIVLCVTGSEALYADMGHFGRRPIQIAWFVLVFPALLVNYFGQGALLLARGAEAQGNPFYMMVSPALRYPLILVATSAATIASQALISGAFSLARQAVQLGYLPRLKIVHTSGETEGQIYLPEVNILLALAAIFLTLMFRSSSNLAGAYGISVVGTMAITSVLLHPVAVKAWGWSARLAGLVTAGFLAFDLPFLFANAAKIVHGGWFPLAVAAILYAVMSTWKFGRAELSKVMKKSFYPLDLFLADVENEKPPRVSGTSIFMTSDPSVISPSLMHHFKHSKVLHKQVILLSITTADDPYVDPSERAEIRNVGQGFYQIIGQYGFMESPKIMEILQKCPKAGISVDMTDSSFYLGRESILTTGNTALSAWRKVLFSFLSRNAQTATRYFDLPPDRVVELGIQVKI